MSDIFPLRNKFSEKATPPFLGRALVDRRAWIQWTFVCFLAASLSLFFAAVLGQKWLAFWFGWTFVSYLSLLLLYGVKAASGRDYSKFLRPDMQFFWILAFPIAFYNWIALAIAFKTSREPVISRLGDSNIFLSARLLPVHKNIFHSEKIGAVVDLCSEFFEVRFIRESGMPRLISPYLDLTPPQTFEMISLRQWVLARCQEDKRVLIHCAYGRGRSYMLALACLKSLHPERSLDELEAVVRKTRPKAKLSRAQRRILNEVLSQSPSP